MHKSRDSLESISVDWLSRDNEERTQQNRSLGIDPDGRDCLQWYKMSTGCSSVVNKLLTFIRRCVQRRRWPAVPRYVRQWYRDAVPGCWYMGMDFSCSDLPLKTDVTEMETVNYENAVLWLLFAENAEGNFFFFFFCIILFKWFTTGAKSKQIIGWKECYLLWQKKIHATKQHLYNS